MSKYFRCRQWRRAFEKISNHGSWASSMCGENTSHLRLSIWWDLLEETDTHGVRWVRISSLDWSVLALSLVGNIWKYLFYMSSPAWSYLLPWSIWLHLYGCYRLGHSRLGQWQCKVQTLCEESSGRQGPPGCERKESNPLEPYSLDYQAAGKQGPLWCGRPCMATRATCWGPCHEVVQQRD